MNQEEFKTIVEEQLAISRELLVIKGQEYSPEGDRLEVFKKAANLQGGTIKQALCGMLAKHVISVYDMCMSSKNFTEERWIEKITDSINYLLLLKAAVVEESREETKI